MGEYFLIHEGVSKLNGAPGPGSGRYPLGSGKRPFQNGGGDPRKEKKIRGQKATLMKNRATSKKEEETEKKEFTEDDKKHIIETGNIRAAYDNRKYLTNADIEAVITRYNKEKNLRDLLPQKKSGMEYINKISKGLETSANLLKNGTNAWNGMVRIIKVVQPNTKLKYIPEIKVDKDKDKKSDSE